MLEPEVPTSPEWQEGVTPKLSPAVVGAWSPLTTAFWSWSCSAASWHPLEGPSIPVRNTAISWDPGRALRAEPGGGVRREGARSRGARCGGQWFDSCDLRPVIWLSVPQFPLLEMERISLGSRAAVRM